MEAHEAGGRVTGAPQRDPLGLAAYGTLGRYADGGDVGGGSDADSDTGNGGVDNGGYSGGKSMEGGPGNGPAGSSTGGGLTSGPNSDGPPQSRRVSSAELPVRSQGLGIDGWRTCWHCPRS
jgi:hypothetical protein